MIIVTGGAGFIGSALVWALNGRGRENIIIVDEVDHDRKERNIGHLQYEERVGIKEFRKKLLAGDYDDAGIEAIIHMGACSDTTETDWEYLEDNNVEYAKDIIRWCHDRDVRCIYASSGATYGDGSHGYSDEESLFDQLEPLNLYGKSKLLVDIWARDGGYLQQAAGLRFFNVFGPNEWHKGDMMSVICKKYPEVASGESMRLFKSDNPDYKDGGQMRDFVYIKDVIAVVLWLLEHPKVSGVYNVGTSKARTWNDVAGALFGALGKELNIKYVDMPRELAGRYQYYTQAETEKLKAAGYTKTFTPLEDAVDDYVKNYLNIDKHLGE